LFVLSATAHAQAVRGIRAADTNPIAPRGGVMMLQLAADRPGDAWPGSLALMMHDGTPLEGVVAWIAPVEVERERHWTDDLRGLEVRAVEPGDDNRDTGSGAPYLLVRLPARASGDLKLDRQTIRPVWVDLPAAPESDLAGELGRERALNRPDPDSPFEHWRWVLLAEGLGMQPPGLGAFDESATLLAEHFASLWRIGLARLERIDPDLAAHVRGLLTRSATDRGAPFAAWIADPAATGTLLTELVSNRQTDAMLAEYVRLWIGEHDTSMVWPEADYDAMLRLAVLSAGDDDRGELSLRFPGVAQSPMRFAIEPNVLMRVLASKPRLSSEPVPTVYGRQPVTGETIVINMPEREMELPLRPRRYAAVPPGIFLSALGAPLSLAEVQTLQRMPVRLDQATLVSIRKLRGRWEVFVDCRRPGQASARAAELPDRVVSFDELRGIEAITILVGPEKVEEGPGAILTVPETGWPRVYFGVQDGSLQVHTRSHSDRWYARIVLPDDWLPHPDLGPALLGFIRTHGESSAVEMGPNASVPWRIEPGRVAIDLSEWDGAAAP
jgi:hypothetical protein